MTSTGSNPSLVVSATGWKITKLANSNNTELAIVDSTVWVGPAATVYCRNTTGVPLILPWLALEHTYSIPNGGCSSAPSTVSAPPSSLYSASPWIRRNTGKDITYMYELLALSWASMSPDRLEKISEELSGTQPWDSPGDIESSRICEPSEKWWTPRYGCQPSSLYAIADYTAPVVTTIGNTRPYIQTGDLQATLTYSGSLGMPTPLRAILPTGTATPTFSPNGIKIDTPGQYLSYDVASLGSLSGKTITINLASPVWTTPTPSQTKFYIADLGGNIKVLKIPWWYQCMWKSPPSFSCDIDTRNLYFFFHLIICLFYFILRFIPLFIFYFSTYFLFFIFRDGLIPDKIEENVRTNTTINIPKINQAAGR